MSFGVSPSDFVMLLKGLVKLARILRREAVDSFTRCARTYRTFAKVAEHLDSFTACSSIEDTNPLKYIREEMETLLNKYFRRIEDFQLLLGSGRVRRSIRRAIAKIKWSQHTNDLEELRQDLEIQISMATLAILTSARPNIPVQVLPGFLGQGPVPRVPFGDHFAFEDARRKVYPILFSDIPNWEYLHEFLLRLFPSTDRGHDAIVSRAYLLRNASAERDILPSGPGTEPIRDVIANGERIEMNVIFPTEDFDSERCPKCNTDWRDTTSVVINCHQCGLYLRFMDSLEDEADPITQLAIDDIRKHGLKVFVTEFIAEIERNGYLDANMARRELKDSISRKFQGLGFPGPTESFQTRSRIRDFRRVTLCQPRWPSFGQRSIYWRADRQLATVMGDLKSFLKYLEAGPDLPMEIVAKAIGSNIAGAREAARVEKVVKEACLQYDSQAQRQSLSMQIIPVLEIYSQSADESMFQLHPAIVKVRCLLWTILHILELEGKLLLSCSNALCRWIRTNPLYESNMMEREESPPLHKLLGVFFIPHAIFCRLTFDIIHDAVSLFSNTVTPPDILGAVFRILKDSRDLCLDYYSEGNLDKSDLGLAPSTLFNRTAFTSNATQANWHASYRRCLESVLRTEGDSLLTQENLQQLSKYWISLYP